MNIGNATANTLSTLSNAQYITPSKNIEAPVNFEFTQPGNAQNNTALSQLNHQNTQTSLIQTILQSLQHLLSQLKNDNETTLDQSGGVSSVNNLIASNMTRATPGSPSASLSRTDPDVRVDNPKSGYETEPGNKEVFTVRQGEYPRVNIRSYNDLTDDQKDEIKDQPNEIRRFSNFSKLTEAQKNALPEEVRDGERALEPGESIEGKVLLDPRVERQFNEPISADGRNDYVYTGDYNITSSEKTTIFQMLNIDSSNSDRLKPVLFLLASSSEDGETVTLKNRGEIIYEGPKEFNLKVETNGIDATITTTPKDNPEDAVVKNLALDRDGQQDGVQLNSSSSSRIRYGAYHHDGDDGEPMGSIARLRVANANLERL